MRILGSFQDSRIFAPVPHRRPNCLHASNICPSFCRLILIIVLILLPVLIVPTSTDHGQGCPHFARRPGDGSRHKYTRRGTRQSRDKAKDVLFVASLVDVVSIAKDKERTSRRKDDEKTKILVLYLVWILFLFGLVLCLFEMVLNKGRNFCQPSPLGLLK